MHFLNHEYRKFEKNPLLGERFRVYADANNPQEQAAQQASSPAEYLKKDELTGQYAITPTLLMAKDKTPLAESIEKYAPGKTKYDGPAAISKVERNWKAVVTEINGHESLIQHFVKLRNLTASPDFNPEDWRWRGRMDEIYKSFDYLDKVQGIDPATKAQLRARQTNETKYAAQIIEEDMSRVIKDLVAARNEAFARLKTQLQADFRKRLEFLKGKWENETPKGYEDVKDSFIQEIDAAWKLMDKLPDVTDDSPSFKQGQTALDEYETTWDDIARLEAKYKYATEIEEDSFDLLALEKEFKEVEKVKEDDIDSFAGEFAQKADQVLVELAKLIKEMEALDSDVIPEKQKEDEIRGLQYTYDKVKGSRDISKLAYDALYSEDLWETEDPNDPNNKVPIKDTTFPLKKGLKHQLEMLKKEKFNDVELRALGLALHESFVQFKKDAKIHRQTCDEKLPDLLEKIRIKREGLKVKTPFNGWKMTLMAPYDAYRGYEIIKEWTVRRYKRAATERVGQFGSKVLQPLSKAPWPLRPLRTLPNEFDKEVEKSEQEEVNQYKEVYANKDAWQIEDIAHTTKNVDELKACLYLLAEMGRLRWDKVALIKQLNRFQSQLHIPEDSAQNYADISTYYERLRDACGAIWDFDTFTELKNKNSSTYDSKKNEYEQNCHEWAESAGTLKVIINGLLADYKKKGDAARVDPILYEKIIDYTVKYGKMSPEDKLYYLIQGIACGLLSPDRGSALNSVYINDYPAIDFFGSGTARGPKPTLQDLREVAALDREAFNTWFHNVAMTMPRVTQRVDKALTQGKELDHDDLTCYLAYMSSTTTENVLKEHSGRFILPLTGVQNATIGMLNYMDNMSEHFDVMSRNKQGLRRFIDSVTRFHGITKGYMYKNDKSYFRWDVDSENSEPRSESNYAKMYGRAGWTCKQNMNQLGDYFKALDERFFGDLYGGKIKSEADAQALIHYMESTYGEGIFGENEPKTVDDLYQSAGAVAHYFIENEPNKIKGMFSKVKQDHTKAWRVMRHNKDIVLKDREEAGLQNIQALRKFYDRSQGGSEEKAASAMSGGGDHTWMQTADTINNQWKHAA